MSRQAADFTLTEEPEFDDHDSQALGDLGDVDEPALPTYDIAAANIDVAQRKIDAANRRLAKAGITERFEMTVERYTKTQTEPNTGLLKKLDRATITLNRPRISYNGYTFAARIDATPSGQLMAMSAPGVELNGWKPESMTCEHCGTNRSRKNVYAVQDDSGGYKVIGSSCLQNYTGIQPEGLWVLTWDDLEDLQEEDSLRDGGGGWARGDVAAETPDVLRIAAGAAAVQGGFQNRYSDRPTGGLVSEVLFPSAYTREEDRALHAAVLDAAADIDPAELKAEILEALDGQDGDWPANIRLLLEEEHVSSRHVTLLASAISAVERMRAKKREKATIASGFIAPVGEKVANIPARVLMLRESTSYYGGREKTSTLVKMQTESGHIVTWWASNPPELDEGDDVVIDRATVKKHETYNDQDQTAVTRAKLTVKG